MNFGRRSFVTWTEAELRKEKQEMEKEHLFKLKKDGKAVGYLKLGNKIWWKTNWCWIEIDPQEGCSEFFEDDNGWDTAHPFVTKDKNGDDVFAGDEVDSMGNICQVMWHKVLFQWCLWHIEGDYYFGSLGSKSDFELIKDEEK